MMKTQISNDILLGSVIDSILNNIINNDICANKYLLTETHGSLQFSPGISVQQAGLLGHALPLDTILTRQTGISGK